MLVTLVGVLVTDHGNVQRETEPQPQAIVVVVLDVTYLNVQTACGAHHYGNDVMVRGVPSGRYTVYGDTLLRDTLEVTLCQTSVHRLAAMLQL